MKVVYLILILVLAFLQFSWIDMMTESKRRNLESEFTWRAGQYSKEFNQELSKLVRSFGGFQAERGNPLKRMKDQDDSQMIQSSMDKWQETALVPSILSEIYIVTYGPRRQSPEPEWQHWNAQTSTLEPASAKKVSPFSQRPDFNRRPQWMNHFIHVDVPGMFLPLSGMKPFMGRNRFGKFIFLEFDKDAMTQTLMPELTRLTLGEHTYHSDMMRIRVLDEKDHVIYDSGQAEGSLHGPCIIKLPFFPPENRTPPVNHQEKHIPHTHWELEIYHNEGSLDAVLTSFNRTNKAISLFVLIFLAGSILLVIRSSRQARNLAKKQMDFVAGISHELLTPLASIQSAGENMSEGLIVSHEKIKSYGKMIEKEGKRLNHLVTQILHFSKIESGDKEINKSIENLKDVLSDAVYSCEGLLEDHDTEIIIHVPEDPVSLEIDRLAIHRVFRNLIENACKYGGKKIDIEMKQSDSEVRVSFINFGPVIPEEEQKKIFEAFMRGSTVVSSNISGTGLGLQIVKKAMERHEGTVSLKSSPEKTVFECVFKLKGGR